MADPKYNSPLANINELINNKMFSIYLSKDKNSDNSEITFGGFDIRRTGANPFYWESQAEKTSWSVRLQKIIFGDTEIATNRLLLLNTGEPYIIMSQSIFK